MTDEEMATRLRSLAPPAEDAQSRIAGVRRRHVGERRTRAIAGTALAATVVAVAAGALAAGDGTTPRPTEQPGGLGPACGFATPFTGFVPGTDSAEVRRTRGTPPTRLVAHAGRGDFRLENLRIEVGTRDDVVRSVSFGNVPADGRDLVVMVGDATDSGAPIPPGRYTVTIAADVSGRDNCGEQAWQRIDTIAGYLVVR